LKGLTRSMVVVVVVVWSAQKRLSVWFAVCLKYSRPCGVVAIVGKIGEAIRILN